MKRILLLLTLTIIAFVKTYAQDVVHWTFSIADKGNGEVELVCSAKINPGWHLYDISIPDGGPNPTELTIETLKGATKVGKFKAVNSKLHKSYDEMFEMEIGYYENQATFVQRFKVTDKEAFELSGDVRAQACDDMNCTPPLPNDFSFKAKDLPASVTVTADAKKDDKKESEKTVKEEPINTDKQPEVIPIAVDSISQTDSTQNILTSNSAEIDLWKPVIDEVNAYGAAGSTADKSIWLIFIGGVIGGFIALLTPCVWPIIPMTVSFFLKRNKKSRAKAIRDAVTYGLAIIIIYVSLGLIITGIFGASALNDLATSAIFNIIFFALLVIFAISFLGAFEMVLPSSWTNKIDSKADSTSGVISIFFMAFTLALVSFSCTGPIIGTLLVDAANSGAIIAPAVGMFGFALALAIPFSLFAIFPSLLESMPKSGGWLNSVKVVLGFLELALALKFLSVADLAYKWHILDREVFLVLWIIIFTLLGLYLLGKLKFAHDSDLKHISVFRLFTAIISLAFAVYLVPGLWGAPLKSISAFAPPLWTQDFNLYDGAVHAKFDNYEEGMKYAKEKKKPVIIDFSGYGCVNCRKMEASVWIDPRVKEKLEKDYVLITLMVDDKESLPQRETVTEKNGKTTTLKTIGDKWSYLQRHKFGTNSQPYYVLLNDDGMPIGPSRAYDENVDEYLKFLNTGLNNYKKLHPETEETE